MRRSLRWRLQLWYTVVLFGVVAGFAGFLYQQVWQTRWRELDRQLESAAQYLDSSLRRFPIPFLEGLPPRRPPFERDLRPGAGGPGGPPFLRPNPEQLLADLAPPGLPPPGAPPDEAYFGVWRADGTALKTSGPVPLAAPPGSRESRPRLYQRDHFREAVMAGPRSTRIVVGRDTRPLRADLDTFAWQLAAAGGAVLLVGLAGGWLISAGIVRPIAAISATAARISATNLSERIDAARIDHELADLAAVLNATFDRLEAAFERQTRFTADASHELRTPLAVVRAHAELALSRPRTADEYRKTVETCLQAAVRMSALVEGLLTLARCDAGKLELRQQPVEWAGLVAESVALFRPVAQDRGVTLTAALTPVEVVGDALHLTQVVTNLLSNAVQYNHPGGSVHLELTAGDGAATLAVSDTGDGIPEADRPHLFERFYRVDKARSRRSGGNGLGLAICKSIVESHGGAIGFDPNPDGGTRFWVRLPRPAVLSEQTPS